MSATKQAVISWGTVISLLAAGNLFFINRLVSTIDKTVEGVSELKLDMVAVKMALKIREQAQAEPVSKPVAKYVGRKKIDIAWVYPKQ
jgi:hypothetical protein